MSGKRRFFLLISIMVVLVAVVSAFTLYMLYGVAFEEERARLVETARSQARLIEAVARHQKDVHPDASSDDAFRGTLHQIREAHERFRGFGDTGEFTLARRDADQIAFLLRHRHDDTDRPKPVPFASHLAEPMRLALCGNSGTVIGIDYRGERVLAAHEPVAGLDLGIVAKIDMAEIRKPFVNAGLLVGAISVVLIIFAALLVLKIGLPMATLLEENENKFRLLFEQAADAIVLVDGETGEVLEFNRRLGELLGYTGDELRKLKISDIDVNKTEKSVIEHAKKICELGSDRFETKLRTKDGELRDVLNHAKRIELDKKPAILSILCDITFQKRREEALRESQEKYRSVLDNAGIGISLLSPEMEVLEANKKMRSWYPGVDFEKRSRCYEIYNDPPGKGPCSYCPVVKTFEDGAVHESLTETPSPDGVRNFRVTSSPVHGPDGQVVAVTELVEELTDKIKLEERLRQSQKLEALGNLAGGIAHDFNNILYAIMGNTELAIEDMPEGDRTTKRLGEVLKSAERASNLVKQVLAFIRQAKPEKKAHTLTPLLEESLTLLRATLPSTIEFKWSFESTSDTVLGDRSQIEQVLMNLFTNAVHAMGEDKGVLTVRVSDVEIDGDDGYQHLDLKPGPYLKIAVSDTGCGIDKETFEHIFEPFFTTKGPGKGTGLGLAVVHGVVKGLDGAVDVLTEPGRGSTFTIFLPSAEPMPQPDEPDPTSLPGGRGRILFVDDEEAIATLGQAVLESMGYDVVAVTSSLEAREVFLNDPDGFDLVITDQNMPAMTGIELASALSTVRPKRPIILCSGCSEMIPHEKIEAAGISRVLAKPISRRDMASCVQSVLKEFSLIEV